MTTQKTIEELNPHLFGQHFRTWREKRGLSLKEAAGHIISIQHLSQFELGKKNINLPTFSRLLMSIGVDWEEYVSDYPGLRIKKYQEDLNQFFADPNAQAIKNYMATIAPYYEDSPESLTLIEEILTMTRELLTIGIQTKLKPNHYLIDRLLETDVTNPLEFDYLLVHLNQNNLKTEQLKQLSLNLIDKLKVALNPAKLDFNAASNYLTIINRLIDILSKNGDTIRAANMIEQVRHMMRPLGAGNRFVIQSLRLDFQEAYNLLYSDQELQAIALAEKITTYLEANIAYEWDPELHRWFIEAKKVFMNTFKQIQQEIRNRKHS